MSNDPWENECEMASPMSDQPRVRDPAAQEPADYGGRDSGDDRCMNAYWRISTSGMEHLLNVGVFRNLRFCRRASPERISFEEPCAVMVLLMTRQSGNFAELG